MYQVLNSHNKLLTRSNLIGIFKDIGLQQIPINMELYIQAMTHKSYITKPGIFTLNSNCVPLQQQSQERMEFVGDSILSMIVCDFLFKKFNSFDEGQLTKLKQRIVDTKTLASFSRFHSFDKYVLLSLTLEKSAGRKGDKLMEDTFEAFVYALYTDLGIEPTKIFIEKTIEACVNFDELLNNDNNYKHQLLERFQKNWNLTPIYSKVSEIGVPHKKTFTMQVIDPFGNILGIGSGSTKREAEQLASQIAMGLFDELITMKIKPLKFVITREQNKYSITSKTATFFLSFTKETLPLIQRIINSETLKCYLTNCLKRKVSII